MKEQREFFKQLNSEEIFELMMHLAKDFNNRFTEIELQHFQNLQIEYVDKMKRVEFEIIGYKSFDLVRYRVRWYFAFDSFACQNFEMTKLNYK